MHNGTRQRSDMMTFDTRDIRVGMDVYTRDGRYLGTVRRLEPGSAQPVQRVATEATTEAPASMISGELLGPMPTSPLGNPGPTTQTPRYAFGTIPDEAEPLVAGAFWVGKLPVPIGWCRFSIDDVLTVTLERVILRQQASDLESRRADEEVGDGPKAQRHEAAAGHAAGRQTDQSTQ